MFYFFAFDSVDYTSAFVVRAFVTARYCPAGNCPVRFCYCALLSARFCRHGFVGTVLSCALLSGHQNIILSNFFIIFKIMGHFYDINIQTEDLRTESVIQSFSSEI